VSAPLETVEIETAAAPDAAVIWLHGLGADGHDFEPVVPELRLPPALGVRFVFPHAPIRPVTLNMGMRMRAWYDVYQLGGGREDGEGIRASQELAEALIARERERGIAARRIVLAGFSQGGAIALHAGLRHGERLAGILALSTWLPLAETLEAEAGPANRDVPVFMAHGLFDEVIPIARAQQSRARLEQAGYGVAWHEYSMPHSVCGEEIAEIAGWLLSCLAPSP
jgi:phospholipase/carboxylesterase